MGGRAERLVFTAPHTCEVEGVEVPDPAPGQCLALAARCRLAEAGEGATASYLIEAAGNAASVRAALDAVRPDGRVIILSSPRETLEIEPYFDLQRGVPFGPGAQQAYEGLRDDPDHWLGVRLEYPG